MHGKADMSRRLTVVPAAVSGPAEREDPYDVLRKMMHVAESLVETAGILLEGHEPARPDLRLVPPGS